MTRYIILSAFCLILFIANAQEIGYKSEQLINAEKVLKAEIEKKKSPYYNSNFKVDLFAFKYNEPRPAAYLWYKYREEKVNTYKVFSFELNYPYPELSKYHELKNRAIAHRKILIEYKEKLGLLLYAEDTLYHNELKGYYVAYFPNGSIDIKKEADKELKLINTEFLEIEKIIVSLSELIEMTEEFILDRYYIFDDKIIDLEVNCIFDCDNSVSMIYNVETFLNYYTEDHELRRLMIKELDEYSNGGKRFGLIDDLIYDLGYRITSKTAKGELLYVTGSFRNNSRYSKDRDAFVACINTITKELIYIKEFNWEEEYRNTNNFGSHICIDIQNNICINIYSKGINGTSNSILKLDNKGEILWSHKLSDIGFPRKLVCDSNGNVYAIFNNDLTEFSSSLHDLYKFSSASGKVLWKMESIIEGFVGVLGEVVIVNDKMIIGYNYLKFTQSSVPNISKGYNAFNIGFALYNINDGLLLKNKPIPSEEPKLINEVLIENDVICFRGRRGNYESARIHGLNKINHTALSYDYGEFSQGHDSHNPFEFKIKTDLLFFE